MIKGIPVILYNKIQNGVDAFNHPVFVESPEVVSNVLVTPINSMALPQENNLSGARIEYELCIPKGDTHEWENRIVEFFGSKWRTVGIYSQWIDEMVPLDWNKKIRVERYV